MKCPGEGMWYLARDRTNWLILATMKPECNHSHGIVCIWDLDKVRELV